MATACTTKRFSSGPPPQLPRSIFWGVQAESRRSSSVGGRSAGSGRRCTAASWMSPSLLPSPQLHVLPAGFQERWGVKRVLFCTNGSRQR